MAKEQQKKVDEVKNDTSLFTDYDIYLFKEGKHFSLYDKLGAHTVDEKSRQGTYFSVWAPNAESVSVIGDFNGWNRESHRLRVRWDESGIWEGFIPGIGQGALYKYHIHSRHHGYEVDKGDPFGYFWEPPPKTSSVVWDLQYKWKDSAWNKARQDHNSLEAPWAVYELHLGSWRRNVEENRFLTYKELAHYLTDYLKETGFTHVEFLPVMEHPFSGSWGYQITGYFAPTSRYGTPQDLMYLIDTLHQNGIGVILDWVPSHFVSDEQGLVYFDGTHLYEHQDPKKGFHPDWGSYIFNYGRSEVRSFLISNALFWLDKYHADGFRVDAVASMLYLDYSRKEGEWIPNKYGGRENIEAIEFLKNLNEEVYERHPDVQTIAEESTAWPMVSKPTYLGGLGFGMKWNMGWMHDTLSYFSVDPVFRNYHQDQITFSIWYAFNENFMLPLSHDEVVHGKASLIEKMPGDEWQKFAGLKLLLGYMYSHPGKKLLFMGGEIGQRREWSHESSLDWNLLQYPSHAGVHKWIGDLNALYRNEPALFRGDFSKDGFEWIDLHDSEQSTLTFLRKEPGGDGLVLVTCNFTPVVRNNYRIGVPRKGFWKEIANSDARDYSGSGQGNLGGVSSVPVPFHGKEYSISVTLPPLAVLFFKWEH
jgi:1,4-alpha-glucan branching enzyme